MLWLKLVEARKSEIATIEENFALLRDSINKINFERLEEIEQTPRALNSKKGTHQQV